MTLFFWDTSCNSISGEGPTATTATSTPGAQAPCNQWGQRDALNEVCAQDACPHSSQGRAYTPAPSAMSVSSTTSYCPLPHGAGTRRTVNLDEPAVCWASYCTRDVGKGERRENRGCATSIQQSPPCHISFTCCQQHCLTPWKTPLRYARWEHVFFPIPCRG